MGEETLLLSQGAEAKVFLFRTKPNASQRAGKRLNKLPLEPALENFPAVMKHRFIKSWRHSALDLRLRKSRHKQEVGCMTKACEEGLPVPRILAQDPGEMIIWVEYIHGETLKSALVSGSVTSADGTL